MSDKKKIFFLIPNLGKGGAERILAHLLNHLNRDLFSLGCIFYDDKHTYPIPENVAIFNISFPGTKNPVKKLIRYVLRIIRMKNIIKNNKPDFFMSFMENIPAVLSVMFSGHKPFLIISVHNPLKHEKKRLLAKIFYPYANQIVVVSQGLKAELENKIKIERTKISVIYNPIDIPAINNLKNNSITELTFFNENIPVIITAGRLKRQKGQRYLLSAFAILNKRIPSRLIILGEGPEAARLRRLAQALHLERNIRFLGFQPNPFKFFARSTLFVLSSIFEGFGNVLVEAMACGVPVISTDCPVGPREIIQNGHNGILVPPKNPDLLAEAMYGLLSSKNERERLTRNALENLRQYDVNTIVSRYEAVFSGQE